MHGPRVIPSYIRSNLSLTSRITGDIQAAVGILHHRHPASLRISQSRPHCVIPDLSRAVTGRKYHCPFRISLHLQMLSCIYRIMLPLALRVVAHLLTVLTFIAIPKRKYLMSVYPNLLVLWEDRIRPLTYSHGRGKITTSFEKKTKKLRHAYLHAACVFYLS